MKRFYLLSVLVLGFIACEEDCDDVYRIHSVEVRSENIQEVYTVRTQTDDTINRYSENLADTSVFMVAGDEFQDRLTDGGETFLFHLRTPDSLYQFNYLFENGDCHVEKLSGHERISL